MLVVSVTIVTFGLCRYMMPFIDLTAARVFL